MSTVSAVKRERNTITVKAGDTLFKQGDPSDCMYYLEAGRIEITNATRVLEVIEGEGVFGEMGLVNGKPRSATAKALTDSEIVVLNQGDFYFLIQHSPMFAIEVMQTLSERVRRNTET